jgi:hypothetical protein
MQFTPPQRNQFAKIAYVLHETHKDDQAALSHILIAGYVLWNDARKQGVINDVIEYLHVQVYPSDTIERNVNAERHWASVPGQIKQFEPATNLTIISEQDQRDFAQIAKQIRRLTETNLQKQQALAAMLHMVAAQVPNVYRGIADITRLVDTRVQQLLNYQAGELIPEGDPLRWEIDELVPEFVALIGQEGELSATDIGAHIFGYLLFDYDDLCEISPTFNDLEEAAQFLDHPNGTETDLQEVWGNLKRLVRQLEKDYPVKS